MLIRCLLLSALLAPLGIAHTQEPQRRRVPTPQKEHRWGLNAAFLVHNSPFREFSVFAGNTWYAQGYRAWLGGNAGLGFAFGLSYSLTFPNRGLFRIQFQIETTGWISGVLDIGGGLRIPLKKGINASVEGYFSFGQSGGSLAQLNNHQDTRPLYAAFFGFKFRGAFEFPLSRNWYSTLYISYAAYPWHAANQKNLYINGARIGAIIDSLQIGLEFGQKF